MDCLIPLRNRTSSRSRLFDPCAKINEGSNTYQLSSIVDVAQSHTYGLLWTSGHMTWYFDDQAVLSASTPSIVDQHIWVVRRERIGATVISTGDGFEYCGESSLDSRMAAVII